MVSSHTRIAGDLNVLVETKIAEATLGAIGGPLYHNHVSFSETIKQSFSSLSQQCPVTLNQQHASDSGVSSSAGLENVGDWNLRIH